MRVFLNGNQYELQAGTGVARSPIVEFPDNIRLDGQQQRKDRRLLSSWAIDRWSGGLGLERMNVDVAAHRYRLWDAENVDTRWETSISLSPAFQTCTIVPSRGDLDIAFNYLGDLYFAETQRQNFHAFKFSPPLTIGSLIQIIANSSFGSLNALLPMGGTLVAFTHGSLVGTVAQMMLVPIPTLGSPSGGPALYMGAANLPRFSQLSELGGTMHLLSYTEANLVRFDLVNQSLGAFTRTLGVAAVVGTYLPPLVTDGLTMYAQLPQGIYNFDASPNILIDTSRSIEKNGAMAILGQDLYFKNKKSFIKYSQAGDEIVNVGYDREDGLPAEKFGEITALCSTFKWAFAAVKGGTYSHILTYDKKQDAWQYYSRIPSAGLWVKELFMSDSPDNIDRLWVLFSNYKYPGYFYNPVVNPAKAGTYSFIPAGTGHVTFPIFDGGMAEEPGAFYDLTFNGWTHRVGGQANEMQVYYGLDEAAPSTSLGVVSSTSVVKRQQFLIGSPYGLEGYKIQPRFLYISQTQGTSPIFNSSIIHYLKLPKTREQFDFTIDLKQTAISEVRPLEAIIGSLDFERNSRTLLPFWYGAIATKAVKVLEAPVTEDLPHANIFEGERGGFVRIRCVEII